MNNEFYIVKKEVLSDVLKQVIEAKELLMRGNVDNVTEVLKKVKISRSTYYKYKDAVFTMELNKIGE